MPLVGYVLYPGQQIYLECHGEAQIAILEEVMEKENKIFLATQKEVVGAPNGEILQENLFSVGIIAEIKHLQKKGKGTAKILVEGIERASLINLTNENGVFFADIQKYPDSKIEQKETQETEEDKDFRRALVRTLKRLFTTYTRFVPQISGNVVKTVKSLEEPDKLVDYISSHVMLDVQVKQRLLELTNTIDRMVMLSNSLEEEISVINYEIEINEKLRGRVDKNQREYYIREQIHVLQNELGEGESKDEEVKYYLESIENVLGPGFAQEKEHLKKEVKRLNKLPSGSQEVAVIKSYLDICLELPWQKSSVEQIDILKAEEVLNKNHFGLNKVKEQILETIAIKAHSPKTKWQVLCLVGPPGVGKTSIAKAIAEALNRKYVQISLGGLRDEAEVRGHRKTYVGAMPGRIINALRTAKENNPVILLDEIDKMANDARSDPTAAFLEVLDYEQNKNFKDNYIEIPFDLSNVLFITTANYAKYGSVKALQHGKTYYFRARIVRVYKGKKYYSDWTEVKKIKVNKVELNNKLSIRLDTATNRPNLYLQNRYNGTINKKWNIIFKYSTKKNGTYKTIKGTYHSPCMVEKLQKKTGMKKGKTYYLKAVVKVPCEDGSYVLVVTSAFKYVGR